MREPTTSSHSEAYVLYMREVHDMTRADYSSLFSRQKSVIEVKHKKRQSDTSKENK